MAANTSDRIMLRRGIATLAALTPLALPAEPFEIDLPGFLARPREDEFASFRDHYPRCSECSAEVRAWTELDDRLRRPVGFGVGFAVGFDTESGAAAVAQHPSAAQHPPAGILAGYEADPGALGATERRGLERSFRGWRLDRPNEEPTPQLQKARPEPEIPKIEEEDVPF